jgi:hypothetical protein
MRHGPAVLVALVFALAPRFGHARSSPLSVVERARTAALAWTSERDQQALTRTIARTIERLPRGMIDKDLPWAAQAPSRRMLLVRLANEYRALADAPPGSRGAARRAELEPLVGPAAIRDAHIRDLRRGNIGMSYPMRDEDGRIIGAMGMVFGAGKGAGKRSTVNLVAHEAKHARDFAIIARVQHRVDELLRDNQRLAAAGEVDTARIDHNLAEIGRLEAPMRGGGLEIRAYGAGAFAQGRLGEAPRGAHLVGQYVIDSPRYPLRALARATVRGYVLGAGRALAESMRAVEASAERKATLKQKVNSYLSGYRMGLERRAEASIAGSPPSRGALVDALRRAAGSIDQKLRRLASVDAAYDAGRRDAQADLSATGRIATLLR